MLYKLKKFVKYIIDPDSRFAIDIERGRYDKMSDEEFLKKAFKVHMGYELDLENPRTFNEKLQWLKLYDRKPVYTKMADKYEVKDYLKPIMGKEHIIPLIGAWEHFEDIDVDSLPNQFVLKTNCGSGNVFVCRDKQKFDFASAKKIESALKRNYFFNSREWPYKDIKPLIFAEQYMQDGETKNLNVYKIFCFDGRPEIIQTIQNDKTKDETIDYFDTNWNKLLLKQNFPNSEAPLKKPETLGTMLDLASKCSKGFPFLRVDLYEINKRVYFSEFTFYSDSGFAAFNPPEWDRILGDKIVLPIKN